MKKNNTQNNIAYSPIHGVNELTAAEAMKMLNTMSRDTQVFCFERFGNNYSHPQQAVGEIVWNSIGAGAAHNVWVFYDAETRILRILNDGNFCNINTVFQYGISTSDSEMSQYGTGTSNAASFLNPSNTYFGMNVKTPDGNYVGIRAPFDFQMQVGELTEAEIAAMKAVSHAVVTEFFVYDEKNVLSSFDFVEALGEMFGIAIMNGVNIFFNGQYVTPIVHDCGVLGRGIPNWEHEERVKTDCGNFILQYTHLSNVSDPSLDKQGVWLYFNGALVERKGVAMLEHVSGKSNLKAHPEFNRMRTIVNIVTEGLKNPLKMPFNNTKTALQWNAPAAKVLRAVVDERVGDDYRQTHELNTEAGQRKAIDYICKQVFKAIPDLHYDTAVKLYPYDSQLEADAVIYSGEKYSYENVEAGKTVIHGIVEFKKGNINSNHINQLLGYIVEATPFTGEGQHMPKAIFAGHKVAKHVDTLMAKYNAHLRTPIKHEVIAYEKCNPLWRDSL